MESLQCMLVGGAIGETAAGTIYMGAIPQYSSSLPKVDRAGRWAGFDHRFVASARFPFGSRKLMRQLKMPLGVNGLDQPWVIAQNRQAAGLPRGILVGEAADIPDMSREDTPRRPHGRRVRLVAEAQSGGVEGSGGKWNISHRREGGGTRGGGTGAQIPDHRLRTVHRRPVQPARPRRRELVIDGEHREADAPTTDRAAGSQEPQSLLTKQPTRVKYCRLVQV